MTQSPEKDVVWLTQEAYDKLKDELENLPRTRPRGHRGPHQRRPRRRAT